MVAVTFEVQVRGTFERVAVLSVGQELGTSTLHVTVAGGEKQRLGLPDGSAIWSIRVTLEDGGTPTVFRGEPAILFTEQTRRQS